MPSQHPFGRRHKPNSIPVPAEDRPSDPRYLEPYRQYASRSVAAPLLGALGIMFAGISLAVLISRASNPTSTRGCVDDSGTVVPDEECERTTNPPSHYYHGSGGYPYRWHYGSHSYSVGSRPIGGSFAAPSGVSSFTHTSTRGIFGGSGLHFSSGS